jgi:tripartite-type tricarboxylate transporter receptor subunit TctC
MTGIGVLGVMAAGAQAQTYPTKPITIIIPFPPGSGNDTVARILSPKITEDWKQQIVIDNRPGAGAAIGAEIAARAVADGYSLFLPSSSNSINMHSARAKYDLIRDFTPVALIGTLPFILVVPATMPVRSIKELVALAKSHPRQMLFASSGMASTGHLVGELLRTSTKIEIAHVPYKGGGLAARDLIAGQVHLLFTNMSTMTPFIKAGRLRGLGVSGDKRSPVLPDVPTMVQAGFPQLDIGTWFALLAPTGTPPATVAQLNKEIVRVVGMPDVRQQLANQGVEPSSSSPEEAGTFLKNDVARWGRIIKEAGVSLD